MWNMNETLFKIKFENTQWLITSCKKKFFIITDLNNCEYIVLSKTISNAFV